MSDFEDLGLIQRSSPGKKVCRKCGKGYNNRAIPEYCVECNNYLGGRFVPKDKNSTDPQLITSTLASVRTNTAGVPTRTFVDLALKKVCARSLSDDVLQFTPLFKRANLYM